MYRASFQTEVGAFKFEEIHDLLGAKTRRRSKQARSVLDFGRILGEDGTNVLGFLGFDLGRMGR